MDSAISNLCPLDTSLRLGVVLGSLLPDLANWIAAREVARINLFGLNSTAALANVVGCAG